MAEAFNTGKTVECPEPVEGLYFVYMLSCKDDSIYCGSTSDMSNRLKEHNSGEAAIWTKNRRPVRLVYYEQYSSLVAARRREKQLKGWARIKKTKLISGEWHKIESL